MRAWAVLAAGGSTEQTFLRNVNGPGGPTSGMPTTLSVPDVLISELELAIGGGNTEQPPLLPSPLAE